MCKSENIVFFIDSFYLNFPVRTFYITFYMYGKAEVRVFEKLSSNWILHFNIAYALVETA